jgi:hypothetical protein
MWRQSSLNETEMEGGGRDGRAAELKISLHAAGRSLRVIERPHQEGDWRLVSAQNRNLPESN